MLLSCTLLTICSVMLGMLVFWLWSDVKVYMNGFLLLSFIMSWKSVVNFGLWPLPLGLMVLFIVLTNKKLRYGVLPCPYLLPSEEVILPNGSFYSSLENFSYPVVLNLLIVGKHLDINHFTIFVISFLLLEKKFLYKRNFLFL